MKKLKLMLFTMLATILFVPNVFATCDTQKDSGDVAEVTHKDGSDAEYCTTLTDALNSAKNEDTVKLLDNINVATYEKRGTTQANEFTFDLNGKKITSNYINGNQTYGALYITDGSTVTIIDSSATKTGRIEHTNANGGGALNIQKGKAIIKGGTFTNSDAETNTNGAIQVGGSNTGSEGQLVIEDGARVEGGGVYVTNTNGSIVMNGGVIETKGFAISGNGSKTKNSVITITGGTITSKENAAIYHPQTGELNITGGTITGAIGIVARQGTINVDGGTINATGTGEDIRVGDAHLSGQTCTSENEEGCVKLPQGVAVVVDNSEGAAYADVANVTIQKGEFNVPEGKEAVLDYKNEEPEKNIKVSGGTFNVDVEKEYLASNELGQSESGKVGNLYKIEIKSENGKVEAYKNAVEGEDVVVKITADKGYEINLITILDKDGKEVKFVSADGGIKFTMPASDVTISVTFKKVAAAVEENPKTGDNILMYLGLGLASVAVATLSVKKLRKSS